MSSWAESKFFRANSEEKPRAVRQAGSRNDSRWLFDGMLHRFKSHPNLFGDPCGAMHLAFACSLRSTRKSSTGACRLLRDDRLIFYFVACVCLAGRRGSRCGSVSLAFWQSTGLSFITLAPLRYVVPYKIEFLTVGACIARPFWYYSIIKHAALYCWLSPKYNR